MVGFVDLNLNPKVLRALEAMGYEEPTPVQVQAIPKMLEGKDLIVQAQTGTGKTAAYGIPILEKIAAQTPRAQGVQALVLAPTRELALQVAAHLSQIGQFIGLAVLPIYGGQGYDHQIRSLQRGVHVVVATPGRLLDLLQRRALTLNTIKFLVLDEADEMLDMGFQEDVERILSQTPADTRQTTLFSATMPPPILTLARKYLRNPERIILTPPKNMTVPTVEQSYYQVPPHLKVEALMRLLDGKGPRLALVFCATKRMVDSLYTELQGRGYRVEALHGDMTQGQRNMVMDATRAGRVEVLVATDVAARGIDIPEVSHVINFDIPQDPDSYVHRIGRTARAGRSGEALTIVTFREYSLLKMIENTTGVRVLRKELPSVAEVEQRERAGIVAQLQEATTKGQGKEYKALVEEMAQELNPMDIAAAALGMAFGARQQRQEIPQVALQEPPAGIQRHGPGRPATGRHFGPRRGPAPRGR
ncbi:MAG: DEAD/DEAH box helicase [Dehalococcoidia bacterium]|nr:DEAD/DEAH box helicase [Dehalococcoidia bacterium]